MIEFKRVAHYYKKGENPVEVERAQVRPGEDLYITVPFDETTPNDYSGGVMGVKGIAPDIYSIDNSGQGKRPLVYAMLLNAAFRGNPDAKIIVTTVPEDATDSISAHIALGFADMGATPDADRRGRPLVRERILLNRGGTKLATHVLGRANIRRTDFLPDGRNRQPALSRLQDEY